jgi:glycosyltransferase involved in cell wall biosynthesis
MRQIYDGVDIPALLGRVLRSPAEVRAELGIRSDELMLTMVGHLRSWKGQDVVLAALAHILREGRTPPRVVFIGGHSASEDGWYVNRLEEIVRTEHLEGSAVFLGPRRDAAEYMNAADVVVHASSTPEPFGLVVLEGMALGKPVIASRLGGPAEVVTPGTGLLFDPAAPGELAEHLRVLVSDPGARRTLGAAGRRAVEAFGIKRNVEAIQQVYRDLLRLPR